MPNGHNGGNHGGGGGGGNGGGNHNGGGNGGGGNGGGGVGNNHPAGGGGGLGNNHPAGGGGGIGNNHPAGGGGGIGNNHPVGGGGGIGNNHPVGGGGGGGGNNNGNGGTTAPVATASWTNNYQQWLREHPNPGHSPGTPDNASYAAWLQQHPHPGQSGGGAIGIGNNHPAGPAIGISDNHPAGGGGNGTGGVAVGQSPAVPTPAANPPSTSPGIAGLAGTQAPAATSPADSSVPPSSDAPAASDGGAAAPAPGVTTPTVDNKPPTGGTGTGVPSADKPASGGGYTVAAGDTMWNIAQQHGMSLSQLEALNPQIKDPGMIFPGQTVNVGGSTSESGGVATTPAKPLGGGGGYTVAAGDTMWDIAQKHGMSLSQLESLNPQIKEPGMIFPGQTVNLGHSSEEGAAPVPPSAGTDGGASQLAAPLGAQTAAVGGSSAEDVLGSVGFPTTSSYPPADSGTQQSSGGLGARIKALGGKAKGWGGIGSGTSSTDPIKNTFYANDQSVHDTNPLNIKDDGRHGQKLG